MEATGVGDEQPDWWAAAPGGVITDPSELLAPLASYCEARRAVLGTHDEQIVNGSERVGEHARHVASSSASSLGGRRCCAGTLQTRSIR
jgi:hypothetical protein